VEMKSGSLERVLSFKETGLHLHAFSIPLKRFPETLALGEGLKYFLRTLCDFARDAVFKIIVILTLRMSEEGRHA
jgi:hypothetical protein